jgi:hypothetical protein
LRNRDENERREEKVKNTDRNNAKGWNCDVELGIITAVSFDETVDGAHSSNQPNSKLSLWKDVPVLFALNDFRPS